MPDPLLLYPVVLPAAVAALVVLALRRPWRPGAMRDGTTAAALAVGLGFAAGLLLDPTVGPPQRLNGDYRLPESAWEWLPLCALAFLALRLVLRREEGLLPFGSWMVVGAVSLALAWVHARGIIDMETWDRKAVAPLAIVLGTLWTVHASMVESLCVRRGGPALPLALTLQSVAIYACITLAEVPPQSHGMRLAEAALGLAATLAVLTLVAYLRPRRAAIRGLAFPVSGAQIALLLQGYLDFDLPWISVLLLAAAPAALFLHLRPRRLIAVSLLRAGLVLLPSGAAIGWSWYLYTVR